MKQVLVIKLRHHGDVLLTTALYRALHELFPGIKVDTLIYKETLPLLENNPHLNQIHCIDRKLKGFARLKAELKLIKQVRNTGYDAVVHLTDQWTGALVAAFSKADKRVQMKYAKRNNALWHACFTHAITPPPRGQAHAIELNLLCLSALGKNPSAVKGQMTLLPSPQRLEAADSILTAHGVKRPFVLIHPAARWPFKCWEDHKFAQVVQHIRNRGFDVVLTCSPDPIEVEMTSHIETLGKTSDSANDAKLVNLGGTLSLPVLAALLSRCTFYVGVDSAPMHMAAALNVPQVALFGPSWLNEWRPWSDQATVIYAGDFGPLPHPDSINTDDPTRLLAAIPTEAVIQAIDALANPV